MATDSGATNRSLGQGEGGICEYNENYPEFCPQNNPPPADYLFLQEKFKQIFGVNFQFIYHRLETNYANTFGNPSCWYANDGVPLCRFGSRYNFISQLPEHSIVHYAIQSYKWNNVDAYVYDMTGASHLVEINFEPFNSYGLVTFSHEYGHTWGLPHSFYNDDDGKLKVVQFDGIMGNGYGGVPGTSLMDPLDPMERYALEPENGYLNFSQFIEEYNSVTIGDNLWAPLCDGTHFVNLVVQKSEIIEQDGQAKVKIELMNKGNMPTGYVPVEFINYKDKTVFAKASIDYLPINELVTFYYPIENKDIALQVVIDPQAQVNNQLIEIDFFKNSPPVASAGDDMHAMPGDQVTLSAYQSYDHDDFGIEKYFWRQLEEKSVFKVDLQETNTASPYFQIPARPGAAGWLIFELTVTDQLGLSATDTVGVMVHNIPPQANAGQDLFIVLPYSEKICLDGSNSSDPDGDIVNYKWEQTEGELLTFTSEEIKQPILCFLAKDKTQNLKYGLKLNVQDNGLLWDSDEVKVYIDGYPLATVGLKSQLLIPSVITSPLRIYLTWAKNQETDLAGYKIYRKVGQYNNNSTFTYLSQVSKEEYIDANLKPGYVYSYKITAVDQAGHESGFSSSIEVKVPLGGKILQKKLK